MQNKEKIRAAIAEQIELLPINDDGQTCTYFPDELVDKILAAIAPHLETGAGLKPTKFEKDNLPEDVKLLFHKGVGLYQCIQNYELGVLTKDEFVSDMRKVESKFKQDTLERRPK